LGQEVEMSGFGYDPEAVIQDADIEQYELEQEGRYHARRIKKMNKLRLAGRLDEAAMECTHRGGGYPLGSRAATNNLDPRAGQKGFRCQDCGSALDADPFDHALGKGPRPKVVAACEIAPRS
jgi:hypothetical protein